MLTGRFLWPSLLDHSETNLAIHISNCIYRSLTNSRGSWVALRFLLYFLPKITPGQILNCLLSLISYYWIKEIIVWPLSHELSRSFLNCASVNLLYAIQVLHRIDCFSKMDWEQVISRRYGSVSSRRSPPKLPDFQNPKYCWSNLQSSPSYQGSWLWHHTLHHSCHLYSRVDPKGHFIDTDSCVRRKLKPKKSGQLCILVKVTLWVSQLPEKVRQKPLKTVPAPTDPESKTSNQAWKNSNNRAVLF